MTNEAATTADNDEQDRPQRDEKSITTYLDEDSRKAMERSRQSRVIFAGSPKDPNLEFQKILQDTYKNTKGAFA